MTEDEMLAALEGLARILTGRTISANLFVVGGAVMVLSHHARGTTDDVDAVINNRDEVLDAANEVADEMGLPQRWINSDSMKFIPQGKDPEWDVLRTMGTVTVHVANTRTMLAMKLKAGRRIKDGADIAFLLSECGITETEDAVAVFDEFHPDEVLEPRSRAVLRDALQANTGT